MTKNIFGVERRTITTAQRPIFLDEFFAVCRDLGDRGMMDAVLAYLSQRPGVDPTALRDLGHRLARLADEKERETGT